MGGVYGLEVHLIAIPTYGNGQHLISQLHGTTGIQGDRAQMETNAF